MARIRSLHPGIFTDEAFVSVEPLARQLYLGLWTEADDHGIFEWKPVTLKMRIHPADVVDVAGLLAQLAGVGLIRQFEIGSKKFGAVRNFCRYQRPRQPKYTFPLPDTQRAFVAADDAPPATGPMSHPRDVTAAERKRRQRENERQNSEECHGSSVTDADAVTDEAGPLRRIAEVSRQMEDGGYKKERTIGASAPENVAPRDFFEEFWKAYPKRDGANPKKPAKAKFEKLCKDGEDPESIIAGARQYAAKHPKPTPYVVQATRFLNEHWHRDMQPSSQASVARDDDFWRKRLDYGRQEQRWSVKDWGPKPGDVGCEVPAGLLQQGDGQGWDTRARNHS